MAAAAFIIWQIRQHTARVRLQQIDRGERCVSCNGVNVTVTDGKARCNQCGYVADLTFFHAAKVTSQDIAEVTQPEKRH